MNLKALSVSALFLALAAFTPACGDDTGGDTSSGDGSDGNDTTSGSSSECSSTHACENDECECTTPGKEGTPCDDADACAATCEVCS